MNDITLEALAEQIRGLERLEIARQHLETERHDGLKESVDSIATHLAMLNGSVQAVTRLADQHETKIGIALAILVMILPTLGFIIAKVWDAL